MALLRRAKAAQSDFFPGFADVSEIGVGSLATVYRAREVATNRLVALKLLNVRDASPRAIESFERESLALGAVSSHPHIVTLYRNFRAGDGRPVLVLELCNGSIADRMQDGHGLPVREVVAIGIKVAGALETAHRAQILHRDVKPQNILVTEFGEPALADFGVAMLQSSTQTTAGLFDFTTLHAAPELLEGGETSAATDVYELASTLYQLIAGRSAFRAYEGESPASVILRILRDPVQPLVESNVPSPLSDLLIYAMSKDKDARPPTAEEFAGKLASIEAAQGWPRTPFVIRDAAPSGTLPGERPLRPAPAAHEPLVAPQPRVPVPVPVSPPAPVPVVPIPPAPVVPIPAAPVEPPVPAPVAPPPVPILRAPVEPPPVPAPVAPPPVPIPLPPPAPPVPVVPIPAAPTVPVVPMPPPVPHDLDSLRIDDEAVDEALADEAVDELTTGEPALGEPTAAEPAPDEGAPEVVAAPTWAPPPREWQLPPESDGPLPSIEPPVPWHTSAPSATAAGPSAGASPAMFPIPPAAPVDDDVRPPAPAVPVWVTRTPTLHQESDHDHPHHLSLRSRWAALDADDTRLAYRSWLRRRELPWSAVHAIEARFGGSGARSARGHLVAVTERGTVALRATRRPRAEVQRLQGILDAYRRRAHRL